MYFYLLKKTYKYSLVKFSENNLEGNLMKISELEN